MARETLLIGFPGYFVKNDKIYLRRENSEGVIETNEVKPIKKRVLLKREDGRVIPYGYQQVIDKVKEAAEQMKKDAEQEEIPEGELDPRLVAERQLLVDTLNDLLLKAKKETNFKKLTEMKAPIALAENKIKSFDHYHPGYAPRKIKKKNPYKRKTKIDYTEKQLKEIEDIKGTLEFFKIQKLSIQTEAVVVENQIARCFGNFKYFLDFMGYEQK